MRKGEIEAVFERVRTWPEARQAYAAYILCGLERDFDEPYVLSDEENAALDEAELELERGEVASEAEIETAEPLPRFMNAHEPRPGGTSRYPADW